MNTAPTRICIINIYGYPLYNEDYHGTHGGAEVDLFLLAEELAKDDAFAVDVLTGTSEGDGSKEYHGNVSLTKVYRIGIPRSLSGAISALTREIRFLNTLRKIHADVYIQEAAGHITGLTAFYCWLAGKQFIYRVAHDNDCNKNYIQTGGIMGKLYWYGLTHAAKVISQNERQQKMLVDHHCLDSMIIGNAHHIPGRPETGKDTILWIARCETWKRPELFLDIVKAFPEERFTMIAPSQKHEMELFSRISAEAQKLPNLTFIEKVPFSEVQDYFNKAKLFIGTSDFEGFPNTYLQACIGATPIVSLRVNPDEFITKHNLGYCAEGDMEKMKQQIRQLLCDQEAWQARSNNAFQYVKDNHDISTIIGKWKTVMEELVGK